MQDDFLKLIRGTGAVGISPQTLSRIFGPSEAYRAFQDLKRRGLVEMQTDRVVEFNERGDLHYSEISSVVAKPCSTT